MASFDSDHPLDDESTVTNYMGLSRPTSGKRYMTLVVLSGPDGGRWCQVPRRGGVIGRHPEADIRLSDPAVSRRHAVIEYEGEQAYVRDLGSHNGLFVSGRRVARQPVEDGADIVLSEETTLRVRVLDEAESQLMHRLQHAATTDELTGAPNRHYLIKRLNEEVTFACRHHFPLSVMLIDIDHFKQINDVHGHRAGDMALQLLSISIQSTIRTEDVFGRYGGDEFLLVVRNYPAQDAARLGERLLETVRGAKLGAKLPPVTLSIGVADYLYERDETLGPVDLIMRADAALYQTKRAGRNGLTIWRPRPEPTDDYAGDMRDTLRVPRANFDDDG